MGLFNRKTEEQRAIEQKEKEEYKEKQTMISEALRKVMIFPGSKEEFEDYIGYKTEWIHLEDNITKLRYRTDWCSYFWASNPFDYYNLDSQINVHNVYAPLILRALHQLKHHLHKILNLH